MIEEKFFEKEQTHRAMCCDEAKEAGMAVRARSSTPQLNHLPARFNASP